MSPDIHNPTGDQIVWLPKLGCWVQVRKLYSGAFIDDDYAPFAEESSHWLYITPPTEEK